MNDIWELLGIEPTDDKKIIRRAYAEQSRLHHPEEEPEYFTALNQAYKAALDHGIRLKNTENMSDSEKGSTEIRETQKIQKEQEISKTQEIQITAVKITAFIALAAKANPARLNTIVNGLIVMFETS